MASLSCNMFSYYKVKLNISKQAAGFFPFALDPIFDINCSDSKLYAFAPPNQNEFVLRCHASEDPLIDLKTRKPKKNNCFTFEKITFAAAYLILTRWLFLQSHRYECEHGLTELRHAHHSNRLINSIYNNYFDQLHNPDSEGIIKSAFSLDSKTSTSTYCAIIDSQLTEFNALKLSTKSDDKTGIGIIIPAYGKVDYTLRCLASLLKDLIIHANAIKDKYFVDIVIVDDCHPLKEGHDYLGDIADKSFIKFKVNDVNLGFLNSCNNAVNYLDKTVEYICFLNNDTQCMPGWLVGLVDTFDQENNVGIVGSQLISADKSLQEAGGIVWNDASAWNFGRNAQFDDPEFAFLRNVDYISGASLMIKAQLWRECGGFDTRYSPAYYEDTDLCIKIRTLGYKVLYQPTSKLVHYEGVSCGTDTSQGIKKYQEINKTKFLDKWKGYLNTLSKNGEDIWISQNRGTVGSCLIIESLLLTPNKDAGSLFMINNCFALRELGYCVTYIPANNFCYMKDIANNMGSRGIEVLAHPRVKSPDDLRNIFNSFPMQYKRSFDVVVIARPENIVFVDVIREAFPSSKIIYYTHDLHYLRMTRAATRLPSYEQSEYYKEIEAIKAKEFSIFGRVDLVVHVSEAEQEVATAELHHNSTVLRPAYELVNVNKLDSGVNSDVIFIGNFLHTPNAEGMRWFVQDIMPILVKTRPDIVVNIVGQNPPKFLLDSFKENFRILGYVEDLNSLISSASVAIAPLLSGAGVKGKILSSLSAGLPVVTTAVGAEGIIVGPQDCKALLVADVAGDFANAIIKIIDLDRHEYQSLREDAFKFIDASFSSRRLVSSFKNIFSKLGLPYIKGSESCVLYRPKNSDRVYDESNSFCYYSNELARDLVNV